MHTDNRRGTFDDIVRGSPDSVAAIARRLRDLLQAVYPDVAEVPRPGEQHADYGVGLNKSTEIFGYLCPLKDYVRLGFYYGGALPDPKKLLQGSGKRLRHIKIRSLAEAEGPERTPQAARLIRRGPSCGFA
jgi:flavin-dependent dehydrogenase